MAIVGERKSVHIVDLSGGAQSSFSAVHALSLIDEAQCFHTRMGLRLPLGIYNVSVSRVCEKLSAFCSKLESFIEASTSIEPTEMSSELARELVDYIELAIYAAAEHVDDLKALARGFFDGDGEMGRDPAARRFLAEVKGLKAFVSATANAIKHQQARIRLYSLDFKHSGVSSTLHGYFIEGVVNGVVGPSAVFHHTQKIFSITTLAWEILLFLLQSSRSLNDFLNSRARQIEGPANQRSEVLAKAVVAAARLPLFTFDEEHPFKRATFVLRLDSESSGKELDSGLYGSFLRRWDVSGKHSFGGSSVGFVGDGVTRVFDFPLPSRVSLQHWQEGA